MTKPRWDVFDYAALCALVACLVAIGFSMGASYQLSDDEAKLKQVEGAWARALAKCEGKR